MRPTIDKKYIRVVIHSRQSMLLSNDIRYSLEVLKARFWNLTFKVKILFNLNKELDEKFRLNYLEGVQN